MTKKQFKDLQVGQQVVLTARSPVYGFNYPTPDRRGYLEAGTVGTVAAVNVPYVRGPERTFCCVDFAYTTRMVDDRGTEVQYTNQHCNPYRVACTETNIDLVPCPSST